MDGDPIGLQGASPQEIYAHIPGHPHAAPGWDAHRLRSPGSRKAFAIGLVVFVGWGAVIVSFALS